MIASALGCTPNIPTMKWINGKKKTGFRKHFFIGAARSYAYLTRLPLLAWRSDNGQADMDSNHELDKIFKSRNLLILKSR
jgi:hypothetical protein